MKVSFPLGSYTEINSPGAIKSAITERLVKWFGKLPRYKIESLSISASWQVWVRLNVKTEKLDYPAGT